MKILVTGSDGQVGYSLLRVLSPLGDVVGLTRADGDLSRPDNVEPLLERYQPALIVNAAAYTAVDKAESEPEMAQSLNVLLPRTLAEWAARNDAKVIHYSTDYVYSGQGERAWQESDAPSPASVYGRTKLAGDEAVLASNRENIVFRTSWVYGARGRNFMLTMLKLANERESLDIVSDQIGAPTPAWLIAQATALAVHQSAIAPQRALRGLYHLTCRGETSWHGFAAEIIARTKRQGMPLKIHADSVKPIPTADYPAPAPRPLNSRLNVAKLESELAIQLPDWQDALSLTLRDWKEYSSRS